MLNIKQLEDNLDKVLSTELTTYLKNKRTMNKYYKKVLIKERLPKEGIFVTTIDEAGEHRVYRRFGDGWNMRDVSGVNSPNDNLPLIYWLEEVDLEDIFLKANNYEVVKRMTEALITPCYGYEPKNK